MHVLCVCPGFTRTEFQSARQVDTNATSRRMLETAEEVADQAVRAVGRGAVLVNGMINRVTLGALKFVPHRLLTAARPGCIRPEKG